MDFLVEEYVGMMGLEEVMGNNWEVYEMWLDEDKDEVDLDLVLIVDLRG